MSASTSAKLLMLRLQSDDSRQDSFQEWVARAQSSQAGMHMLLLVPDPGATQFTPSITAIRTQGRLHTTACPET